LVALSPHTFDTSHVPTAADINNIKVSDYYYYYYYYYYYCHDDTLKLLH